MMAISVGLLPSGPMNKNVYIMSGISGAGKSTYVNNNRGPNSVVCSADDFFINNGEYQFNANMLGIAHAACFNKYINALADDSVDEVWVDNTSLNVAEAARYVESARNADINFVIIELCVNEAVAHARNVHNVPATTISRQFKKKMSNKWPTEWPIKRVSQ